MDEERGWLGASALQRIVVFTAMVVAAAGIVAGAWWVRNVAWNNAYRVNNPAISPATMDNEGDGPQENSFRVRRRQPMPDWGMTRRPSNLRSVISGSRRIKRSQALTGAYRQAHPEDNSERQTIHEHVSVTLGAKPAMKPAGITASAKQRKRSADAGR
jgi:hypothetical protein